MTVGEIRDPEWKLGRREQDLLASALAPEKRPIVPRRGLGDDVRGQARRVVALLLGPHDSGIEDGQLALRPETRSVAVLVA